jgi:hypothetical protein
LPFLATSATMQLMAEHRADRLVWIFGTGRSGSTWLAAMMGDMAGGRLWNEPLVGKLFGDFHSDARPKSLQSKNFVMADAHSQAWLEGILGSSPRKVSSNSHQTFKTEQPTEGMPGTESEERNRR